MLIDREWKGMNHLILGIKKHYTIMYWYWSSQKNDDPTPIRLKHHCTNSWWGRCPAPRAVALPRGPQHHPLAIRILDEAISEDPKDLLRPSLHGERAATVERR